MHTLYIKQVAVFETRMALIAWVWAGAEPNISIKITMQCKHKLKVLRINLFTGAEIIIYNGKSH